MDWRQRRERTNIDYLLLTAEQHGLTAGQCLNNTGLSLASLETEGCELWQELAVIRNLVALKIPDGSGLQVGECYQLTSLGLLGYTMLASRTLWEAMEVSQRFRVLGLSICPLSLESDERGLWLLLDDSVLPADARRLVVERGLAAWKRVLGDLLQRPYTPLEIRLSGGFDDSPVDYAGYFGCPVTRGAPASGMLLDQSDLTSALPLANTLTQQTCASLCQQLCDSLDDVQGALAKQVLHILLSHSNQRCRADQVAARLGMSERTLHRRLSADGHGYRQLDERVRRNMAERLLGDSSLGLESIAQQLGYSEAAGFSRAFKRWTGLAPDQWRRRQQAEGRLSGLFH